MDPDANLKRQLELAKEIMRRGERRMDEAGRRQLAELADELAEMVEDLDGWIRGGGFLPKRWSR